MIMFRIREINSLESCTMQAEESSTVKDILETASIGLKFDTKRQILKDAIRDILHPENQWKDNLYKDIKSHWAELHLGCCISSIGKSHIDIERV